MNKIIFGSVGQCSSTLISAATIPDKADRIRPSQAH